MGKFLAALLLIALAGVPAYIMATGVVVDFDVVTAEHPLGRFEQVDAWLRKHEFEPTRAQRGSGGPKGTTHQRYMETIAADSGQFLCYVDLWTDSEGVVRTLVTEFPSRSTDVDPSYTRTQGLSHSLWNTLAGTAPMFGPDNITPVHGARGLRSDLDQGQIRASWIKTYTDDDREYSIVDRVRFQVK